MAIYLAAGAWAVMAVVMYAAWRFQRARDNGGWSDVFWSFGTGAVGVACALWPASDAFIGRQVLIATLVAAWGLRLGSHLRRRVARSSEDPRYSALRKDWGASFQKRMLGFLQIQAPVSGALCLSIALAARRPAPELDWRDLAGLALLASAVAGEALADAQLRSFKASAARGAVCDAGLWAWSRHPDYFFEWLVWLAYPIIALVPDRPWSWLSLAGPVLMYLLLTRGSGAPPLEAAMLRAKGAAYRDYQARVSPFFPLPPKPARPHASAG